MSYESGLEIRRAVLGADYVDNAVANADDFTRPLQELVTTYCWGDVWGRSELDRKTRSMLNLAMLTALNRPHELRLHVRGAINNGLSATDIREVLLQAAIYCGVPAAVDAFRTAHDELKQLGGDLSTERPGLAALPIDAVLDDVVAALAEGGRVVVAATPGSGKTTRVPVAVADAFPGRVLVLEPRRVAARSVAGFVAAERGEALGRSVGLVTRDDRRTSAATRIEFITEGVLTRHVQRDPELAGVSTVIFDEFHERSLVADVGLALTLDTAALRDDLRVVVMSATLDADAVAALLGDAPVVSAAGVPYEVQTFYRPFSTGVALDAAVSTTVRAALEETSGDVLVFLPGAGEIRWVSRRLERDLPAALASSLDIMALHGQLRAADQDLALRPARPGRRKVVLATNVAETSLTVAGVTAVVDSGQVRRARYRGAEGFSQLVTERISQAEADQRRGRAGRLGPGRCYRLWAQSDQAGLSPRPRPEIQTSDLTGLALELAAWGVADPTSLAWLDPPPEDHLDEGRAVLRDLALLDDAGRPTDAGRDVLRLGIEPRFGAMVLTARQAGPAALREACALVALLEEGDLFTGRTDRLSADLGLRLDALEARRAHAQVLPDEVDRHEGRRRRVRERADRLARRAEESAPAAPSKPTQPSDPARWLLAGMADRVAQRRPDGGGRYLLRHGGGVRLDPDDPLAREPFLLIAAATATAANAPSPAAPSAGGRAGADLLVRLAVPIPIGMLPAAERSLAVRWDPDLGDGGDVSARVEERLDRLVLRGGPLPMAEVPAAAAVTALLDGIRRNGLGLLGGHDSLQRLQPRVALCRAVLGEAWPDLSDAWLLATLEQWLVPYLAGARRRRDLARIDLPAVVTALLPPGGRATLDRVVPQQVAIPTGRMATIDYHGERPVLAVKLQELFGWRRLPVLAEGNVALVAELLSPAGRTLAVTDDLERFWTGAYQQVRSEMRGRYPKHPWPEDPLAAAPTAATNRAAQRGRRER